VAMTAVRQSLAGADPRRPSRSFRSPCS
jgi:hypothetical protein